MAKQANELDTLLKGLVAHIGNAFGNFKQEMRQAVADGLRDAKPSENADAESIKEAVLKAVDEKLAALPAQAVDTDAVVQAVLKELEKQPDGFGTAEEMLEAVMEGENYYEL